MNTPRRRSPPAKKPAGPKKPASRKSSSERKKTGTAARTRKTVAGRKPAKAEAARERDADVDDRWVPAAADIPAPPAAKSPAAKYMPFVWVLVAIALLVGAVIWRANR